MENLNIMNGNKFKPGDLCCMGRMYNGNGPVGIILKTYIATDYDSDRIFRAIAWNFKIGLIIDISQNLWCKYE